MTKDTSPENLRKFLESDDPGLVRIGLSMAKGSGLPEELLPTILRLYMWNDDKTIRSAAKSIFNTSTPAETQAKIKNNWKVSYRTLSITGDKFPEAVSPLIEAFKSQDEFAQIVLEPLIKALEDEDAYIRENTIYALEKIGDKRAVQPLIKALGDKNPWNRQIVVKVLGKIGDKRAVQPLIKALGDKDSWFGNGVSIVIFALGQIGDRRAVEPLIRALEDKNEDIRQDAINALGNIGDKRAVEPLIRALEDKEEYFRQDAAKALGKIGDKIAVESLIKILEDTNLKPVIYGHSADDGYREHIRQNAAEALGNIGDKRAVEPLTNTLRDEDSELVGTVREALKKLDHEVE